MDSEDIPHLLQSILTKDKSLVRLLRIDYIRKTASGAISLDDEGLKRQLPVIKTSVVEPKITPGNGGQFILL